MIKSELLYSQILKIFHEGKNYPVFKNTNIVTAGTNQQIGKLQKKFYTENCLGWFYISENLFGEKLVEKDPQTNFSKLK